MRARRLPVLDRVDRDGEAVVLVGREVVRLSALAVGLLDACVEWTEEAALTEAMLDLFGAPPAGVDPAEATTAALSALHARGLVERG